MSFTEDINQIVARNGNRLLGVLPHWRRVKLSEIGSVLNGYPFESRRFSRQRGIPLIRIRDIVPGKTETFFDGEYSSEYLVRQGDLIVGMDGDFNAAFWSGPLGLLNQRVCKIHLDEQFYDRRFLGYVLPGYLKAVNDHTSSITVKHLSSRTLLDLPLPLPPLAEQSRIADKIDELFTDLAAGVASLERVKRKLSQYRATVLQAAVTGRLTEAWRKQHGTLHESGPRLLERILIERRRQWEARTLARYEKYGKKPPKNWLDRYHEPSPPKLPADGSPLPPLPEGWCWGSLDQAGHLQRGRSRHRPRDAAHLYGGPYPFIQTGDIRKANLYVRSHIQTYSEAGLAQSQLWPAGTLCITIAANIAETAILTYDACFPDSVVGYHGVTPFVSTEYSMYFVKSVREHLDQFAPATAQKNINDEILSQVPIPIPPPSEQVAIVETVNEKLSQIDALEAEVERGLARACRLRQAILKAAFEGRLVQQDPSDESAGVLLERIRTEAAATAASMHRGGSAPSKRRGRGTSAAACNGDKSLAARRRKRTDNR